jgi:hypothetical protein
VAGLDLPAGLLAPCVDGLEGERGERDEHGWVRGDGVGDAFAAGESGADELVGVGAVGLGPLLHRPEPGVRGGVGAPGADGNVQVPGTCVSLLLDPGVLPHIVREIVGHSDIEVTMTIYAHAAPDEKRAVLRKLGDALG